VRTETRWGVWEPASPAEVAELFSKCAAPWWIAGGYAIELAAGRVLREHADVDVLLLRRDQLAAQEVLAGWEWWAADPPGTLRRWAPGETLAGEVSDIWCRPAGDQPWRIQLMLDEHTTSGDWVSRRNTEIRRPISSIGGVGENGVPYLLPEIQLFDKAKNPRPKDETDFAAIRPQLTAAQWSWLREALVATYGDHHWLTTP
jgi:hypothetical protein